MSVFTIFGIGIEEGDIVKILTVFITGFIAIFLFFLNQLFTRSKEKRELITNKTEELFIATTIYNDKAFNSIDFVVDNFNVMIGREHGKIDEIRKVHSQNISELFREISKIEMLLELYFHEHRKSSKYPISNQCNLKQIILELESLDFGTIISARDIAAEAAQKIYQFCSYIAELNQMPFYRKSIEIRKST